jgi:hypothetical protein
MSSDTSASGSNQSGAADEVRKAFSALPLGDRFSTLFKVEIDLLGDVAHTVLSEASRALDEICDVVIGPRQSAADASASDQTAQ